MNLDGTENNYKLRLSNVETCGDCPGSRTSYGVVIEFMTIIGNYYMNSIKDNSGGWAASDMRKYLNTQTETNTNSSSIFSKLPSDLLNVIIPTAPIISSSKNDIVVSATGDFREYVIFISSKRNRI